MKKLLLLADVVGLTGCAGLIYGAWLIYIPAGFIVGGTILVTLAALAHRID